MIDIHCHILPGIDDGAKTIDASIEMAEIAVQNGVKKIIATPHYIEGVGYTDKEHNQLVLDGLKRELTIRGIELEIFLGNEVYVSTDIVKLLEAGEISTLNNSRYILMELSMLDMPIYLENIIYNLKIKGINTILAHPERYAKVIEDPNIVYQLVNKGVYMQLNLPSLLGFYGEKVKTTAEILLRHNMIHFVGTDIHSPSRRSYQANLTKDTLSMYVDEATIDVLLNKNPQAILDNKEVLIDEPKMYTKKNGLSRFLQGLLNKR